MPIITTPPEWIKYIDENDPETQAIKAQLILGSNIYYWRKYRNMSQQQLATKAKLTQSIISQLEDGDYNPTMDVLCRISNALQVSNEILTKEKFNRRFFEILDYFVSKVKNIDILKLMKLAYFTDLESQDITGYKLTGIDYHRRYAGPFNSDIYIADKFFEKKGDKFVQKQNLAKRVALTREDEKFLDKIIKKYGNLSSTEIRDLSYATKPMAGCTKTNEHKMGELIF